MVVDREGFDFKNGNSVMIKSVLFLNMFLSLLCTLDHTGLRCGLDFLFN